MMDPAEDFGTAGIVAEGIAAERDIATLEIAAGRALACIAVVRTRSAPNHTEDIGSDSNPGHSRV